MPNIVIKETTSEKKPRRRQRLGPNSKPKGKKPSGRARGPFVQSGQFNRARQSSNIPQYRTVKQSMPGSRKQKPRNIKNGFNARSSETATRVSSEIQSVLRAITTPKQATPVRWAGVFEGSPTCVSNPWKSLPVYYSGGAAGNFAVGGAFMAGFRSLTRAFVTNNINGSGTTLYTAVFYSPETRSTGPSSPVYVAGTHHPSIAYFQFTSGTAFHGPYLGVGKANREPGYFFWLDAGSSLSWRVTTVLGAGDSAGCYLESYNQDAVEQTGTFVTALANGANTSTYLMTSSGYYRFVVNIAAAGTASVVYLKLSYPATNAVMSHVMTNQIENNLGAIDQCRVLASEVTFSNGAPDLYAAGFTHMAEFSPKVDWYDLITNTAGLTVSLIDSQNNTSKMSAKKGNHMFLKPLNPEDFNFQKEISYDITNGLLQLKFDLQPRSNYYVMYVDPQGTANQAGTWSMCQGIEYESRDEWRVMEISNLTPEACSMAIEALKPIPQFHENPVHWAQLWKDIKTTASTVISGIIKYGPIAYEVASVIGSLL